jgi:hypothetical protein
MQRIAMVRAAIATTVIVTACTKGAERPDQTGSRAAAVAVSPRWCWDTVEVRALGCSGETAHRSGDTLNVRLANGRELHFVDDPRSEAPGGYHYLGRIPQSRLHVVQQYGHETWPRWIFVSERTGRTAVANDEPVMSPDSSRFVTASEPDWNNCSERDHPSLDVWRFADPLPVLEWRLDPWDCRRLRGWGPTNPHWRGSDTLEFLHNEQVVRDTAANAPPIVERRESREIAVHDRHGWRLIAR